MKEYICKEDLIKRKRDINLANTPWNFIDDAPTVTKADILNDFREWLIDEIVSFDGFNEELLVVRNSRWRDAIDIYLAEMESEK